MRLILLKKKTETPEVISFFFKFPKSFTWQAGQFLKYHLEEDKYFSIASSPKENVVILTTKFSENDSSLFKKRLYELKKGDSVEVEGPYGKFTLDKNELNHIFIAGGIGITSFRSIIFDLYLTKKSLNITLLYASKTKDIVYKEELEEIAFLHPEFKVQYFIGENRLTLDNIKPLVKDTPLFYISGPEKLVESFEEQLLKLGVRLHQIKRDYFSGYETL